jgi:hypothetical protein
MEVIFRFAIVIVPLVPIFLLSRLLILSSREFLPPVPSILIGNGVAFAVMLILGAIALSTDGTPQWSRSVSLFSIYALVVLYDLLRHVFQRLEQSDVELLPRHLNAPLAKDRTRRRP